MNPSGFLLAISLLVLSSASGEEYRATDAESFGKVVAMARPGDVVILADGNWDDARLKVRASGTAAAPIVIRAETPGKVVLRGDSRLSLAGSHLVVEGLWFHNPTGEEAIETRIDSDEFAHSCRIAHCAVVEDGDAQRKGEDTSRFLSLYGSGHVVERCRFGGHSGRGATVVAWLEEGVVAGHRLAGNHFGPREPLGKNGGETIRIGDSSTSMLEANCIVEDNLFERCDGEAECISNKSCGNVYRRNHFVAVSGTLTLRHGNGCLVEGNVFLGREAGGTGGVRVIGEDHVVSGNWFQNLRGDDERSALCVMMGIPDTPLNGYAQVKGARITGNIFLDCKENIVVGLAGDKKATLAPVGTVISGNRIQINRAPAIEARDDLSGVKFSDNEESEDLGEIEAPREQGPVGPSWWR